MAASARPPYFIAFFTIAYASVEEAKADAPDLIAAHIARSREMHRRGTLLMAGAFVGDSEGPLRTMAIFTSRDAAEEYAMGDPFVMEGKVTDWHVREWGSILG